MMSKDMNISLLLCEKSDEQARNIKNVFDTISFAEGDNTISYEILTIVNQLNQEEQDFSLLYFIEYCDEGQDRPVLYLGRYVCKNNKQERNATHLYRISRFIVENCTFPKNGTYEVKAFMIQEKIDVKEECTSEMMKYMDKDKLVATCPLIVEFK